MASELYDVLGVSPDATVEDVRKAYKKRALETHPDRNRDVDKETAEERFREVSMAYEVLSDPEKRKLYDTHGTWPPPQPGSSAVPPWAQAGPSSGARAGAFPDPFFASDPFFGDAFPDPFTNDPFFARARGAGPGFMHGSFPQPWGFTDPFALFNSMFAAHGHPHGHMHSHMFNPRAPIIPMNGFPLDGRPASFVFSTGPPGGSEMPDLGFGDGPHHAHVWSSSTNVRSSLSGATHRSTRTEMRTDSSGRRTRTTRIETHRDAAGNEHVVTTYPDGRRRYTLNGLERPPVEIPALPAAGPRGFFQPRPGSAPPDRARAVPVIPGVNTRPRREWDPEEAADDRFRRETDREKYLEQRLAEYEERARWEEQGRQKGWINRDRNDHRDGAPEKQTSSSSRWRWSWKP